MEHGCLFYVQLQGKNPNTGMPVDQWGCSIAWLPVLLCENAQKTLQAGAAIESFRNQMVRQNNQLIAMEEAKAGGQVYKPTLESLEYETKEELYTDDSEEEDNNKSD
jgi:hypothetical protein